MDLDCKTIQQHIKVLLENNLIVSEGSGYGDLQFLSEALERNYETILEIWEKFTTKMEKNDYGNYEFDIDFDLY